MQLTDWIRGMLHLCTFSLGLFELLSWDDSPNSRGIEIKCWDVLGITEITFTCSEPAIETLEKGLKFVKS